VREEVVHTRNARTARTDCWSERPMRLLARGRRGPDHPHHAGVSAPNDPGQQIRSNVLALDGAARQGGILGELERPPATASLYVKLAREAGKDMGDSNERER
jgi:hypothetical protein